MEVGPILKKRRPTSSRSVRTTLMQRACIQRDTAERQLARGQLCGGAQELGGDAGRIRELLLHRGSGDPDRRAAPTVATSPETDNERIGETSMTTPVVEVRPAKQWPPLRGAAGNECRRANEITSETSSGVPHGPRPRLVKSGDGRLAYRLVVGRAGQDHVAGDIAPQRFEVGSKARHGLLPRGPLGTDGVSLAALV
jgi:hypothetical protein